MTRIAQQRLFNLTILITGLGYFVDSYDAFSFNVFRMASLTELGLSGDELTRTGVFILNCQVMGTLLGGIFWGTMGDRIGRKKALLGSILIYSVGMMANAFVQDTTIYALTRAVVGFGIAGEVGLGATLVAEIVRTTKRTYSLALFTALGLLGVVAAALSIEFANWRTGCLMGGAGGLVLLFLRHRLFESPLFDQLLQSDVRRGKFLDIFRQGASFGKWLACIFILAPNFFATGLLLTLAPEMAKSAGVEGMAKANIALALYFTCAVAGDLISAHLSEKFQSRRTVLFIYMIANAGMAYIYVYLTPKSLAGFYALCAIFGLFNLWAIATTATVEQFKTSLRATVTTTSMNFARACLVPMNLTFLFFKPHGVPVAALVVGVSMYVAGMLAIFSLRETFGQNLEREIR